jgi:hypothetical protein
MNILSKMPAINILKIIETNFGRESHVYAQTV